MTNFSKMHQLQQQSGLTKRKWNNVLNHAASAVSQCVKENKLSIDEAKREVSLSTIQDTLGIYHGIVLDSLQYTSNINVVNMITLLKQKAIDKKALAKDGELGSKKLQIYNEIAARGDYDTSAYN
jgi:predicted Zn-dependent protease with MMP-like domain